MQKISSGHASLSSIETGKDRRATEDCLRMLYRGSLSKSRRVRNKALTILFYLNGVSARTISRFLFISLSTVRRFLRAFDFLGVEKFLDCSWKGLRKSDNPAIREAIFSIMHCPPPDYGINRTTWTIRLLCKVLIKDGYSLGPQTVSKIINEAGYRFRKAKKVLTSNDPKYREKLAKITKILSQLGLRDRFFSIDEFGPFSVKMKGGRRLVRNNEYPTVPQWQHSKGFLIVTAALELSTNQVIHFYSQKKNSSEMIKLLEILTEKYAGYRRIYLSWDEASWHASKLLLSKIRSVNLYKYRQQRGTPIVRLAPLPARAQFLNVIESIFSGMARAIIHNSDYQSVDQAKAAIDRYFTERNLHFQRTPKRAGNKIWGKERVASVFREYQNCKNPRFR